MANEKLLIPKLLQSKIGISPQDLKNGINSLDLSIIKGLLFLVVLPC
jgi:hypothetical protein